VGVNVHRGTDIGVSEKFLHVLRRGPIGQEAACEGVPHGVCNFADLYRQSGLPHISFDGFRQSGTGGNRAIRMNMADKNVIAIRVQPPVFQIIDDRFANLVATGVMC